MSHQPKLLDQTGTVLMVIVPQPEVPRDASDRRDGAKLVDNVARDKVDIIVAELQSRVLNPVPCQLIQLCFINPLRALRCWWLE